MNLAQISIEAAEEIQRLNLGKKTDLKNVYELSKLIREEFNERLDYSRNFSESYFWTYKKIIPSSGEESIKYQKSFYERLENIKNQDKKELQNLMNFCSNLSDSFQIQKKELDSLKGPCFR